MSNFYYYKLSSDTFLKASSLEEENTVQLIIYSNGNYYRGTTQFDSPSEWISNLSNNVTFDNEVLTVDGDVAIELSLVEGLSEQKDFMSGIVRGIISLKKEIGENQDKLSQLNSQLSKDKSMLNSMKEEKLREEKGIYETVLPMVQSKEDKNKSLIRQVNRMQ